MLVMVLISYWTCDWYFPSHFFLFSFFFYSFALSKCMNADRENPPCIVFAPNRIKIHPAQQTGLNKRKILFKPQYLPSRASLETPSFLGCGLYETHPPAPVRCAWCAAFQSAVSCTAGHPVGGAGTGTPPPAGQGCASVAA